MSETAVMIPSDGILLEASYEEGLTSASDAVILCHPHPLYGGAMDNNVVLALKNALAKWGWTTLRFNFRGVGRSGGTYADGKGEARDLFSVVEFLEKKGKKKLHIAGYSFGVWIALLAIAQGFEPQSAILVSPPVDFLDFSGLKLPPKPCLVTLGDRDKYCSPESLINWLAVQDTGQKPDLEILPGCDHFYWKKEAILADLVAGFLKKHFQSSL